MSFVRPMLPSVWALCAVAIGVAWAPSAQADAWPSKVPTAAERGKALYDRLCVSCHGERAAGDGPLAAALVAPVPDLSEGFGDRKVGDLVPVVMHGRGAMPAFSRSVEDLVPRGGRFTDAARDVLNYMRGLGGKPVPDPTPAEDALTVEEIDAEEAAAGG